VQIFIGPPPICGEFSAPTGTFSLIPDSSFCLPPGSNHSPVFSSLGNISCVIRENGTLLVFLSSIDGITSKEIPCSDIQTVEWSPLGSYVVTWSRIGKASSDGVTEGNLKIWSIQSSEIVSSYNQRQMRKGAIQWTSDESFFYVVYQMKSTS